MWVELSLGFFFDVTLKIHAKKIFLALIFNEVLKF